MVIRVYDFAGVTSITSDPLFLGKAYLGTLDLGVIKIDGCFCLIERISLLVGTRSDSGSINGLALVLRVLPRTDGKIELLESMYGFEGVSTLFARFRAVTGSIGGNSN